MAESLIADLFKTPADVRQEETDRLLEQGKASAEAYLTGAGQGGSPIAGAIRGLTAQTLQDMPLSMSNVVRRGMLGLSGGQIGASQKEQQAMQLNQIAKAASGRKPEEIRRAADRAREAGRGDIAMVLEERAIKLEKSTDKIVNKEIQANVLDTVNPILAAAFRADPDPTFTSYWNAAKEANKGKGVTLTDKMAAGALEAAFEARKAGTPTADQIAKFKVAVADGDKFDEAVDKALNGDGTGFVTDPFAPK